ncbi:MAG: hypothetical protein D6744_08785, partial [Planctomycetota bacterium]
FVPRPAESGEYGTPLVTVGDPFAEMRGDGAITLTGFALTPSLSADLQLEPFEVFSMNATLIAASDAGDATLARPELLLLRGYVVGNAPSSVFLAITPTSINGRIELGKDTYVISSGAPGAGQDPIIYNIADVPAGVWNFDPFVCAADQLGRIAVAETPAAPDAGLRTGPCRVARIAIETDWEFRQIFGSDAGASAYAATLLGAVSEIYKRDLNISFEISFLRIWNTSSDPWTQSDTVNQLYEFRDYWNVNMTGVSREIATFFSGRALGGGVAWLGVVCYPEYDYSLSANLNGFFPYPIQNNSPDNWDLMVLAHELGHNFGAPHTHNQSPPVDNCAGGDCSVAPNGTIMSYCHLCGNGLADVRMEFHPQTVNSYMLPYLADPNVCDITVAPPTITAHPSGADLCAGSDYTLTVVAGGRVTGYQWRHDGVDLPGETASSLSLTNVGSADAGSYDVVVSNECHQVTSNAAVVTVCAGGAPGDLNNDCAVDLTDLALLLADFDCNGGGCAGDVDGDGDTDLTDLAVLLANFDAPCP